jgi:DNA-binding transcriptional ArsR family regulator
MVVDQRQRTVADGLFHALADATRRDIVTRSLVAERSISDLARPYPMSFAAVQKHVALLESAGLVTKRREGRRQLVRGNIDAIRRAIGVLDLYEGLWRDRLDRFGEVLDNEVEGETT